MVSKSFLFRWNFCLHGYIYVVCVYMNKLLPFLKIIIELLFRLTYVVVIFGGFIYLSSQFILYLNYPDEIQFNYLDSVLNFFGSLTGIEWLLSGILLVLILNLFKK